MKYTGFLFLLLALTSVSWGSGRSYSSVYIVDTEGSASIFNSYMNKEVDLSGYKKVTIVGYVKNPGVYFFKGELSLLDLVKYSGDLKNDEGAFSGHILVVSSGERMLSVDLRKLNLEVSNSLDARILLEGNSVVCRTGFEL